MSGKGDDAEPMKENDLDPRIQVIFFHFSILLITESDYRRFLINRLN